MGKAKKLKERTHELKRERPRKTIPIDGPILKEHNDLKVLDSAHSNSDLRDLEPSLEDIFDRSEDSFPKVDESNTEVPIDSFESRVGYSSLFRQMHRSFVRQVAFHRSPLGGSLSVEEARKAAFHKCTDVSEGKKLLEKLMRLPIELIDFADLMEFQELAPRVAEWFWEYAKTEGRKEFESGHGAAHITFPVGYMKGVWNIARYIGLRESFIEEWRPRGGIELSLVDMLTQSYFQWQFWLEKMVLRSRTRPLRKSKDENEQWETPRVTEQEAIEHAAQMADRWNRIFMRGLRQLRDLRRYTPLTINNANQVNIATNGGKQVNLESQK